MGEILLLVWFLIKKEIPKQEEIYMIFKSFTIIIDIQFSLFLLCNGKDLMKRLIIQTSFSNKYKVDFIDKNASYLNLILKFNMIKYTVQLNKIRKNRRKRRRGKKPCVDLSYCM